nr:amidohydrolase family protein [Sphingobium nicotianae]
MFDAHAHVFTGDTDRYPIDVTNAKESPEALIARIRDNPIDAARLLAEWDAAGVSGGTAVQYNSIYKTDNRYMLDVVDAHPGRMSAVLILDATRPETPETLTALARAHDVVGLRLFGFPGPDADYPWFDSPAAHRTWEAVAANGLAMDMMYVPGPPTRNVIGRIVALAKRFPDMPVLIDHCGWPHVDRGDEGTIGEELLEMREVRNIQFKFTGINFNRFAPAGIDPARFVRRMVDTFGVERLMWGSDVGNTRESYADMVAMAIGAMDLLSDAERAAVLHDNGRRVLGPRRG